VAAAADRELDLRLLRPEDDLGDVAGRERLHDTERIDVVEPLLIDDARLLVRGGRRNENRPFDKLLERLQAWIRSAGGVADELPAGKSDREPGAPAQQHPAVEYLS
jgi:hypothetical protein